MRLHEHVKFTTCNVNERNDYSSKTVTCNVNDSPEGPLRLNVGLRPRNRLENPPTTIKKFMRWMCY